MNACMVKEPTSTCMHVDAKTIDLDFLTLVFLTKIGITPGRVI
jgi:hypothetical protein